MKRNLFRLAMVTVVVGAVVTTLSSFIATDEGDDGGWRQASGGGCTAYCVWTDNQGVVHYDPVAGTYTDCPKVTFQSSCTPVACTPILPCH